MYSEMLEGDRIAEIALHNPQLVKGIAASLRTLIISSFRAPSTQFVMALLKVSASSGASSSGIYRPTSLAGSNATSTGDSDVKVTPPSRVFSMYPLAVLRPTDPTPAYATSGLPADTL